MGELIGTDSLTQRFTIHIDPLARRPPNDIQQSWDNEQFLILSTRDAAQEYFRLLASNQIQNPLAPVLQAAYATEQKEAATALLPQLLAVTNLTGYVRKDHLYQVLAEEQQRILNLMVEFVTGLQQEKSFPEPVRAIFGAFIALDKNAPRGIHSTCEAALSRATHALAARIEAYLEIGTLDALALGIR